MTNLAVGAAPASAQLLSAPIGHMLGRETPVRIGLVLHKSQKAGEMWQTAS